MRKTVIILVFVSMILLSSYRVNAGIGLSPALKEFEFKPNMELDITYTVRRVSADRELKIYTTGDLGEYASLEKTSMVGSGSFNVHVKLPDHIEKPGKNTLYVRVEEVVDESAGIGTKISVGALMVFYVPYPGKYAEISKFSLSNINEGEPLDVNVEVFNLGKENLVVMGALEILNQENVTLGTHSLGAQLIDSQTKKTLSKKIDTSSYKPGPYNAKAIIDYGEIIEKETDFKIGTLRVEITNWTREFEKEKINPFKIQVESKWNTEISDIYAEVNITKDDVFVDYFKTPSIYLAPWTQAELSGFFNAEQAGTGIYNANITLHYGGETTEKIVDLKVYSEGFLASIKENLILIIAIIAGAIILVMALIITYLLGRMHAKKDKKTKRKR